MTEAKHLADAVEGLFANPENGWFMPLMVATEGLTAAQASKKPAERFNSVWAVVNHVTKCSQFALSRLRGEPVNFDGIDEAYWWPAPGDPNDERAWQEARECALATNKKIAEFIATLDDETIARSVAGDQATGYQIVHGLIGHNGYHACEVISIRHMQGLWLERT